jgi:alpha-galactosidase
LLCFLQIRSCTGWCSWYHFYEKISEAKLLRNCDVLCQLRDADHTTDKLGAPVTKKQGSSSATGTMPTNLFLVDDGYTPPKHWGDWTNEGVDSKRFPHGMKAIADQVRAQGLVPGLWMTPFSADKSSALFKAHPDWILRSGPGRGGCNSGFPGKFFYGMDATKPKVLEHVTESIRRAVHEWGFPFIKLDFLYACILRDHTGKRAANNRMDSTMTRAQAFGQALRVIREAAGPDTFILGCGCPVGPAVGWADAMRVSADAGPTWYPTAPFRKDKNNLPCGRNMVRNSLARISFHNRWWLNDPDCLILRDETKLTTDEVKGIASCAALTGGLLLVSDDLKVVATSRMRIAEVLVPPTGRAATAHDVLLRETPEVFSLDLGQDDHESSGVALNNSTSPEMSLWRVLGLGNWRQDKPKAHLVSHDLLGMDGTAATSGTFVDVFEFWTSTYQRVLGKHTVIEDQDKPVWQSLQIPAHSCHLYAVRQVRAGDDSHCAYIGSNMHFTCGRELVGWEDGTSAPLNATRTLKLEVMLTRVMIGGFVWLRLPCASTSTPRVVSHNDDDAAPLLIHNAGDAGWSVWRFAVDVNIQVAGKKRHSAVLEVNF